MDGYALQEPILLSALTRSQMSLMSNETEFVIAIKFITNLFSIWRYNGYNFIAFGLYYVGLFVNWWGYEVVCVSRSWAFFCLYLLVL